MTAQRTPPSKVQCLRSGRIFDKGLLSLIEQKVYETSDCPACGHRGPDAYSPCVHFQNVDVDVT